VFPIHGYCQCCICQHAVQRALRTPKSSIKQFSPNPSTNSLSSRTDPVRARSHRIPPFPEFATAATSDRRLRLYMQNRDETSSGTAVTSHFRFAAPRLYRSAAQFAPETVHCLMPSSSRATSN
jgi:hypothetical protein